MNGVDILNRTAGAYKLRPYQTFAVGRGLWHLMRVKDKPFIIQMATGAGKSIVIAAMAKEMDGDVLVLQPTRELVLQNYEKFVSYDTGIDVGIYSASLKRKEIRKITYATIQSVYKKPELFKHFKYLIIDECHQVDPKNFEKGMYMSFIKACGFHHICGLTATPYRLQQKFFTEDGERYYASELKMINRIHPFFWKGIEVQIETGKLIEQGFLSPILYRQVDLGGENELKINNDGSEYTPESVREYWQNDIRLMKLVQVIQKIDSKCQRNLIFCSSLLQAHRTHQMLAKLGIRSEVIDGSTPADLRAALVAEYRAGGFKHMINVGVFTTGFDVPELDCVVLARNTISPALYYQMVGRGVRLDPARPDKKLRVYDLVRLSEKLGRVETIKVSKEEDGFRDVVTSEVGELTGKPLFKFAMNKEN